MKISPFTRFLIFLLVLIVLIFPMLVWSGAPLSEPVVQPLPPQEGAPLPRTIAGEGHGDNS